MYALINSHIQEILAQIREEDSHVRDYGWLVEHIQEVATGKYQQKYRKYWGLYAAFLSGKFCRAYFECLAKGLHHGPPTLGKLTNDLYEISSNATGTQKLQFSFASKLCHMLNRHLPIYDSRVRDFYFFTEPNRGKSIEKRINSYVVFYDFLVDKYQRVLSDGLLVPSIQSFRQEFNPQHFTDEKIVDSLIYYFVDLLQQGGLIRGVITY